MIHVIVEVPERSTRRCFWSAMQRWPAGVTQREVTPEQLALLQADAAKGYLSVSYQDSNQQAGINSSERIPVAEEDKRRPARRFWFQRRRRAVEP